MFSVIDTNGLSGIDIPDTGSSLQLNFTFYYELQ